ncbi:MAG: hypothetical protein ACKVS8_03375 [Phycisphaerales bacterium]
MLLVHQPKFTPHRDLDQARRLVDAMAREVWQLHGASGTLNWNTVDRHLARAAAQARADLRALRAALVAAR